MALTSAQLVSRLFKKSVGKAEAITGKTFFEETKGTYNYVPTTSIWLDINDIPNVAPVLANSGVSGVVQYISGFTLSSLSVSGAPNAYYDPTGLVFKDIIPFNNRSSYYFLCLSDCLFWDQLYA